jgi:hypothetical protein
LTNPTTSIIAEVKQRLLSYPEQDWNQKYVHFLIYERTCNLLFEAEDRDRCYFWEVSPFTNIHFFDYIMNCPDAQKARQKLNREFLLQLSPELAAIPYANWNTPITSLKFKTLMWLNVMTKRFPVLRSALRKISRATTHAASYRYRSNFLACLREQLESHDALYEYFSPPEMNKILDLAMNWPPGLIERLFTVVSCIEGFKDYENTIEKRYYDAEFIWEHSINRSS